MRISRTNLSSRPDARLTGWIRSTSPKGNDFEMDLADFTLSAQHREDYARDGVICLRGVFAGWVEKLAEAIEENLLQAGPLGTRYGAAEHKGRFHGDRYMWTFAPKFAEFAFRSPAAALAGELLNAAHIRLFYDHLLVKEPGAEAPTPWHQDLPYWCVEGNQICSVWLTLDEVDRGNGILEFVRGSHRWGRQFQGVDFAFRKSFSDDLESIPDIDAARGKYDIISWEMAPGDCLLFDARLIHGAPGNTRSDRRRRALSTRWLGDDVTYREHPNVTRPIRDPGLKHGDPVECELFPRVWSRG